MAPNAMILDRLKSGVCTHSAEQTKILAAELAAILPLESTLGLHGNLGVGKTTFVQGLARGLGITEPVTSPTFTIFTLHRSAPNLRSANPDSGDDRTRSTGELGRVCRVLVHLDAYRLASAAQLDALMIEDFLTPPYCLAVEWPDNIAAWLPPSTLHLDLSIERGGSHRIALR